LQEEDDMGFELPQLYLVSGSNFDKRNHEETIELALKGGVGIVQLREKDKDDIFVYELGKKLRKITKKYNAMLIVDDRIDIANAIEADGVHIGQEDLPVNVVRRLLGKNKIIGKSTHSLTQAFNAQNEGVDYIGVGPVFETNSKKGVCSPVGIELVKKVCSEITVPFVAIGGIKTDNVIHVLNSGARSVACITAIIKSKDPQATAIEFKKIIKTAK
jgi:thiamine-phosphate pyrophosphorylase